MKLGKLFVSFSPQLMDLNFDSEDYRAMFSNELALALRDIRAEYDAILEAQKGADNDSWYKAKVRQAPPLPLLLH